jgi:hypothetical protein
VAGSDPGADLVRDGQQFFSGVQLTMTVRLDVEPVKCEQAGQALEREPEPRRRGSRFNLGFIKLPARHHPGALMVLDDPAALRSACWHGSSV